MSSKKVGKWFVSKWQTLERVRTVAAFRMRARTKAALPAYEPIKGRLLYVAASCLPYHTSGYTTRTHEVIRALSSIGSEVSVVSRAGYPWDRRDRLCDANGSETWVEGVRYEHLRRPEVQVQLRKYALQAAQELAHVARKRRVAVIHAASNHVNALPALLAARQLGVPFQYEMRGLWELTRISRMPAFETTAAFRQGLELEALVAQNADRLFVISSQLGEYMKTRWGAPAERMSLLPNCVDPERFVPADPESVEAHTIGYAGSLIVYEGLDSLIDAVWRIVSQGNPVKLRIMGDGEARPQLQAQVLRLGLEAHVEFMGKVSPETVRSILSCCALVCLPRKPFDVCRIVPPIKLVEAMAMGKPVVVPDLPVLREEIGESDAASFFEAGNSTDLARVLTEVLFDNEARMIMGRRAREHAVSCRTWRQHIAKVAELAD